MKKESKLSELRWPIGIILAIFGVIVLSVWTIEQANIKPVVMDDYYFESKRDVERNINDIIRKQQAFDRKYTVTLHADRFVVGENSIAVTIETKVDHRPVADANVTVKITRPDTDRYDKMLTLRDYKEGRYTFAPFPVEKIGRWQILLKITTPDKLVSFSKNEVNATR